jgi:spermidine/putrescine transport system substrate-binding protein
MTGKRTSGFESKHGMNRRDFLGCSALAAAGLAGGAGGLGIASAWAEQKSISAVMPGVIMTDKTRAIINKATGIKVENVPYVSPTDTVAKLLAPGGTSRYDLMISNTFFVKGPILGAKAGDEKVRPFDLNEVTNANDLQKLFKDDMQTRDGKVYTIPIFWGYDSPLIRIDHIPEKDPVTQSWGVLFADKYAGKTALRDDAYQSIMVTGLHLGHKDPAAMTKSDLNEVKKFLISKKKNFRTLWTKFGEAVNLMSSGEVWAMYGWMPMRAALQRDGFKVVNAWPSEGLLVWNHAAFIPKDTPNAEMTEQVVNAMLSPDFGITLARDLSYGPVTKKALAAFSKEDQHRLGIDVPSRGVKLYQLKWPSDMNAWIETWGAFKAA